MFVSFNGSKVCVNKALSVKDFLAINGIDLNTVIVEINLSIVHQKDWENIVLKENDSIEVLSFVGGG